MGRVSALCAGIVGGVALACAGHVVASDHLWQMGLGGPADVINGLDVAEDGSAYVGYLEADNGRRITIARIDGQTGFIDWFHTVKDGVALAGPAIVAVGNDVVAIWTVAGEAVKLAGGGEMTRVLGRIERIAPDGKARWQYTLDEAFEVQPVIVRAASEGGLLVGGFVRLKPDDPQIAWLTLLAADGNPIWARTYPEGGGVNDIAMSDAKSALIVGYAFDPDASPLDTHVFKPWALRVNLATGESENLGKWSKSQRGELRAVSLLPGGPSCFAGSHVSRSKEAEPDKAFDSPEAGWLGMLAADGSPLWDKVRVDVRSIAGIAVTEDGMCVASGQLEPGGFGPGARWLGVFARDGAFVGESRSDDDFDGAVGRVVFRRGGALFVAGHRFPPVDDHGGWVARRSVDAVVSKAAFRN